MTKKDVGCERRHVKSLLVDESNASPLALSVEVAQGETTTGIGTVLLATHVLCAAISKKIRKGPATEECCRV